MIKGFLAALVAVGVAATGAKAQVFTAELHPYDVYAMTDAKGDRSLACRIQVPPGHATISVETNQYGEKELDFQLPSSPYSSPWVRVDRFNKADWSYRAPSAYFDRFKITVPPGQHEGVVTPKQPVGWTDFRHPYDTLAQSYVATFDHLWIDWSPVVQLRLQLVAYNCVVPLVFEVNGTLPDFNAGKVPPPHPPEPRVSAVQPPSPATMLSTPREGHRVKK